MSVESPNSLSPEVKKNREVLLDWLTADQIFEILIKKNLLISSQRSRFNDKFKKATIDYKAKGNTENDFCRQESSKSQRHFSLDFVAFFEQDIPETFSLEIPEGWMSENDILEKWENDKIISRKPGGEMIDDDKIAFNWPLIKLSPDPRKVLMVDEQMAGGTLLVRVKDKDGKAILVRYFSQGFVDNLLVVFRSVREEQKNKENKNIGR